MEKSSKRGKIPQSDWPSIVARYEAGETLASIAKTYDCSPPAISYVVSRSRARYPVGASPSSTPPAAAEPQLIKSQPSEQAAVANGWNVPASLQTGFASPPVSAEPLAMNGHSVLPALGIESPAARNVGSRPRETNGFGANSGSDTAAPPQVTPPPTQVPIHAGNGDQRPKLHLSLGNGSHPGNGPQAADSRSPERVHQPPYQPYPSQHPDRFSPPLAAAHQNGQSAPDHRSAAPLESVERQVSALASASPRHDGHGAGAKEGTVAYIDRELRARVDGDIAAFLAAFDAALVQDTQESRSALREATDRLLRAGARTRIELERLEARMPLPRRDASAEAVQGWRQR
jgi:hypothetical protein